MSNKAIVKNKAIVNAALNYNLKNPSSNPSSNLGSVYSTSPFSLHCLCSSTSHLFTSRLRLLYWPTLKIANDLPIFASYYALLYICYCFSHLIGLFSVTWLSLYINSLGFLFMFCFSLTKPTLETLDFTIRIVSAPTFSYFDLYLYSYLYLCLRSTLLYEYFVVISYFGDVRDSKNK